MLESLFFYYTRSDDTQMSIVVAEALIKAGDQDLETIRTSVRDEFVKCLDRLSRLILFNVNAKVKNVLGEKEDTIKENDHVTSRNA